MFDLFSGSHILVLLIVALVVIGPKDLPKAMRIVGQWTGKARAMANEFRKSFDDIARQSELDELRKEIESLRHERPLADIDRNLHQAIVPDDMTSAALAEPHEIETAPPETHEPPPEPIAAAGYAPPRP